MITIHDDTTKNPLSFIGSVAAICWNSKTDNIEKNIQRAKDCINADHGRVLEWANVNLTIDGYSAKCVREIMRHIVGTSVLQASTRYIDYEKKGVEVVTPHSIEKNAEALRIWNKAIDSIKFAMSELKAIGSIPNEDITNLLPLAYKTKFVWKINLRNLIHFMHKRKCTRAYWEMREFADELCKELSAYSEEWKWIVDNLFVPECEFLGYCREGPKATCRRRPTKEEFFMKDEDDGK